MEDDAAIANSKIEIGREIKKRMVDTINAKTAWEENREKQRNSNGKC
jgi:hypothetical protein